MATKGLAHNLRLALYQPEIAQNVGAMLRVCACFGVSMDIIEPTGFPFDSKRMRRAGMDYIDFVKVEKYLSFEDFHACCGRRIVLLDVKGEQSLHDFKFRPEDVIMVGQEGSGVPEAVFEKCEQRVRIDMLENMRSLNVSVSAAIAIFEAIRQQSLTTGQQ
ncbi:MAG: tRNA (cytidine(34)-2'-O)-methyltransferase [Holosporales bacterium]|jgi:tRNA (cytidine/uridine-2'-O-)-methyltransferase|nr:tRNA (cytidine(34)-2'-O)-methyltransferase [Holosporales bacterium]